MTRQSDLTERELIEEKVEPRNIWIAQPKANPNNEDKQWEVRKEQADRATKDFPTREDAWDRAKEIARNEATRPNPAGARLKKSSDGQFAENRFYPHPNQKESGEEQVNQSEDMYETSDQIITVMIAQGKPVKAREYYDPRMEHGLGDGYTSAGRLGKDLYDIGKSTGKGISHSADIKSSQATGDTLTFVYASYKNLTENQLESVTDILGIKAHHIYLYRNVDETDKPYINAMKTSPEGSVDGGVVTTMLDREDIRYDPPMDGNVMAYIPIELL